MKKLVFFFLTVFIAFLAPTLSFSEDPPAVASPVPAPVKCATVVQYSVLKDKEKYPVKFDYSILSAQGLGEAAAKLALSDLLVSKKGAVLSVCRDQYENTAACLASKMEAYASTLKTLSFAARKKLEDSIGEDCKKRSATCGEVSSTEPSCVALPVPTAAGEGDSKKPEKAKVKK